ncbi:MAG: peptidoglycan-binding domain-containing protein [Candidatus Rokuibacteriota bacterium]
MRQVVTALLWVALAAGAAHAADGEGRFSIRGAGLLACETYVKERSVQSKAYYVIAGWLDGYLTALNQFSPDTYDATPFESTELLTYVIDGHCKKHPQDRLFPLVNTILVRLKNERLRTFSPFVTVKVGERQTRVYEEVVRRAQQELARRGHYRGKVDGKFGPAVEQALAGFQRKEKLAATGFPDQATLWRLLRREPAGR